jgi:signal transduction histidine kinase
MKLERVAIIVPALLLLLTWLMLSGLNLNSARYDRQLRAIGEFSRFERALNREVLTARVGLSRNYDALVYMTGLLDQSLDRLREEAGTDPEEKPAIEALAARAAEEEDLIEQFKSRNALLQNSLAYFGILSARLAASDDTALVAVATKLSTAMLRLTLDTSETTAREVQGQLSDLASLQPRRSDVNFIQATLAHGGLLHDLLPSTDAILKALIDTARNPEQDAVRSLILKRQLAARISAREYRVFLYAISLTLLGVLVYFGLQLRARAITLRRRAAFDHVIARISARFINSQQNEISAHVQCALEELARYVGADRAYFVVAGEPVDAYHWLGAGATLPDGWPERALDLASSFDRGNDNIIHIPRDRASHSYEKTGLPVGVGLHGWLCIANMWGELNTILAFDGLHSCPTRDIEAALLRMAFDVIANAVGRIKLEQEKERLEMNLEQARRLETIGTFASGIAHNFNNIVAAILGYAEMAAARVVSGSRPASHLAEIRRAGERARELVEQILTFGSRDDRRRERINVKALIAETRSLLAASLPPHVGIVVRETSEPTVVSAEPAQLQQVILNVCNNAAQAMDEPGVITIQLGLREIIYGSRTGHGEVGPGRFIVVTISDPGRGMDEGTLERIFEPFFTTRFEGNGLGLATAREIVREHDGTIEVQSTVGAGTRFEIWLPSAPSNEPVSAQSSPIIAGRGDGETILLLETDRARLLRYEEVLAALGYEPVGFTTPTEAIEACASARARFDAALICHQPGTTSALDFAGTLHGVAPTLPIILATPSARDLGAPLLAASGIFDVVRYPVTSAELSSVLSRCVAAPIAPLLQQDALSSRNNSDRRAHAVVGGEFCRSKE